MASSSVLYAAAKDIGSACDLPNRKFIKCKASHDDPSECLSQGSEVRECALSVLKAAMSRCQETFETYASCLDKQISQEYMFERCRKQEQTYRDCRNQKE